MNLDFKQFIKTSDYLKDYIDPSPLVKNAYLSKKYQANVYLKLESLLPVGSFKLRGALSKMSSLTDSEKKKTALAVSAGNHAQGVAWAARALGMKALIIMPEKSPLTKITNTQDLGAEVKLVGDTVKDCFIYADELKKTGDYVFIHPYFDQDVIAGQSSIAFELNRQLKNIDYIFSAIGGGGLTTALAFSFHHLDKNTKVIGTQASGASALVESIKSGKYTEHDSAVTFADGVKVIKPEPEMIELIKKYTHAVSTVSDVSIALSILTLMEKARIIAEGAGAISLAALEKMYNQDPKVLAGKNIVLLICGGNIDLNLVDKIIDKGLTFTGRRIKFSVLLKDQPGSLAHLTQILTEEQANILQVEHDHKELSASLLETLVNLRIEVKNKEHGEIVLSKIKKHFSVLMVFNKY